jgi:sugar O-acyltransferase (sialic acid O-acetyltransferase NeuD family)
VYSIAKGCLGYGDEFVIKGFIDNLNSLDGFEGYPPVLGTDEDYVIQPDDVFICAIGSVHVKSIVCEKYKAKGAKFQTLVHRSAVVQHNVQLGDGTIVAETALVGSDAKIGENCLIQSFSVIGHDCELGDYVRIDTHAVCVGGVKVDSLTTVHTGAVLNHNVVVGEGATVAANSFVIKEVKPGTTVWGNPAKFLSK